MHRENQGGISTPWTGSLADYHRYQNQGAAIGWVCTGNYPDQVATGSAPSIYAAYTPDAVDSAHGLFCLNNLQYGYASDHHLPATCIGANFFYTPTYNFNDCLGSLYR